MMQFDDRRYVFIAVIILVGLVYIIRLFFLQVVDQSYKISAENNSQTHVVVDPARGLIYDRNGELLVSNQAAYDIMVIPNSVTEFDTSGFCEILHITKEGLIERLNTAKNYSWRVGSTFMKQVNYEDAAVLQEKMFQYPGFYLQSRTLRTYTRPVASHILGYVGEVNQYDIESSEYYKMGDYKGVIGIESSYEDLLRGEKGLKIYLNDVHNRIIGSYEDGKYDVPVQVGKNLTITMDAELQEYGEMLMQDYVGSIVAIEPKTGEILSIISSPTVDPNTLVGRSLGESIKQLSADTMKPLFNRALMAQYPPGSTFKTVNGLIGMEEEVIRPSSMFGCDFGYDYRNIHVGCHYHDEPLDLIGGVQNSCNSYFCNVFRRILENPDFEDTEEAFNKWREHVVSFGFGSKLGSDVPNELAGNIPTVAYYDRYYSSGHWNFLTVISLAIGQGELLITPLQMANMTATIANKGYYVTPHLAKDIEGEAAIEPALTETHFTTIDSSCFAPIIDGMELAVNGEEGSTARIARMSDIVICGKTGTAENPHGADHSIFIAFAPKDDPVIAIAAYVENKGFGSTYAAPIASLMIEKYISGEVKRAWLEQHVTRDHTPRQTEAAPAVSTEADTTGTTDG